jgi:hypothetical protein
MYKPVVHKMQIVDLQLLNIVNSHIGGSATGNA